jgi:osmotically-inducible protein OsmY
MAPLKEDQEWCSACGRSTSQEGSAAEHTPVAERTVSGPRNENPTREKAKVCPICQATYGTLATHCEKDGALLASVETYVLQPLADEGSDTGDVISSKGNGGESHAMTDRRKDVVDPGHGRRAPRKPSTALGRFFVATVLVLGAVGGYIYFSGSHGKAPGMEEQINTALRTRGFDVSVRAKKDGTVLVVGKVASQSDRDNALAIVKSHGEVKRLTDDVRVAASPVEIERSLNRELDNAGLTGVQAHVDDSFVATLNGTVRGPQERTLARGIAETHNGVRGIHDSMVFKKTSNRVSRGAGPINLVETKEFKLFGLSPSIWESMKYRDSITLRIPGPGRITAVANWQPHGKVALILGRVDGGETYSQKDGASPLRLVYRVTPQDYAKSPLWEVTVANFTVSGPMEGVLRVTFSSGEPAKAIGALPGSARNAAKLEAEVMEALKDGGIQGVTAEVAEDGSIVLKGSVMTVAEKEKALSIAKRFKAIKSVKDIVFVVGS